MSFAEVMGRVAEVFEGIGAFVLVVGLVWAAVVASRAWRGEGARRAYELGRETFGGALLLGLEIFVAADLIRTITVAPTLENIASLGLIVLIRTFLSFSLQVEIDGTLPWKRRLVSRSTPPTL